MLAECTIHTALPATDLQRAERFYAGKLGLTPESEGPDGLFYRCGGGSRFLVFPSGGAASGTHTQMTWNTPKIETAVTNDPQAVKKRSSISGLLLEVGDFGIAQLFPAS